MKELEQLRQENEKLNARLKKAITVFNEQKETISRLTEERDNAVSVVEIKDALITDLRAKIAEKDADDTKFFEQLQEIDALNEEIQNQKTIYEDITSQLSECKKQLEEKTIECANLNSTISNLDDTISDKNSEIIRLEEVATNAKIDANKAKNELDAIIERYNKNVVDVTDIMKSGLNDIIDKIQKVNF
jgi:chromosome segregation ATPase